jgi:hypothetical protein
MKDYAFAKEKSYRSARLIVKANKKTAASIKNLPLATDACILCLVNIAIARMHSYLPSKNYRNLSNGFN